MVTSLLRRRVGARAWRAVHWLAYLCWPIALLHGLGTGSDNGTWWLWTVALTCAAAVLAAVVWRVRPASSASPPGAAPLRNRRSDPASKRRLNSRRTRMTSTAEAPVPERRLLAGGLDGRLATHAEHGPLPDLDPAQIIGAARDAGLTGRGGAGFPVWRKLTAVAAPARPAVVIANAAEGEPASAQGQDAAGYQPHLILDGLQLAARAVGARSAHVYAPAAGPTRSPA